MNKRIIAREWLILLGVLLTGRLWVKVVSSIHPGEFISVANGITMILLPYVAIQLLRSIAWAIRTIRVKD